VGASLRQIRSTRTAGVGEAGWRLGIMRREYVALENGTAKPDSTTYERICELYGWPDARHRSPSC